MVIANSHRGRYFHQQSGYRPHQWKVIHNGIDTRKFSITTNKNKALREEWQVGESDLLVGLIGRIVPDKDPFTFIKAAQRLIAQRDDMFFVIVGDGKMQMVASIKSYLESLGISKRVILAGPHSDMPAIYHSLDILCSSSTGEGFPNVIAEAMSCGIPCVVTNVGDSAQIVGDLGWVVPPGDSQQLASAILSASASLGSIDHQGIRDRIMDHFSLEQMLSSTESALLELMR